MNTTNNQIPIKNGKFISQERYDLLKKEWSPKNENSFSLNTISYKVIWTHKCPNEKCNDTHEWECSIIDRINDYNCQQCLNKKTKFCVCHSFLGKFPEIAKEWDYENNGNLKPEQFKPFSAKKVYWKHNCPNCNKIHIWQTKIQSRTKLNRGCPNCSLSGKIYCECKSFINTHKYTHQHIINEIDYEENEKNGINLYKISAGSGQKVYWKCLKGHKWNTTSKHRFSNKTGCPTCYNINRSKGYTRKILLKDKFPNIFNEIHPTKNNNLDINTITIGSHNLIWWKCSKGHEWKQKIYHRTQAKYINCIYCSTNLLKNKFPDIFNEIHPTKNISLNKDIITSGSNKNVWWIHKCSNCCIFHIWLSRISDRTILNRNCPICSITGKMCCKCKSIKILYPNIVKEWDYNKNININPYKISACSSKNVYWKCSKCSNNWITKIYNRTINGSNCPFCSIISKESKGENIIKNILDKMNIIYEQQKIIEGTRLRFDFYLSDYNLAIEFDGRQHFEYVDFFGGEKQFEKQKINDERKNEYCSKNKIILLRIHYKDISEIEDYLNFCCDKDFNFKHNYKYISKNYPL